MKIIKTVILLTSVMSSLSSPQRVIRKIDHKKIEKIALLLEESAHKGVESDELGVLGKSLTAFEIQAVLRKRNTEGKTCAEVAFGHSKSTRLCTLMGSCDSFYVLYQQMQEAEGIASTFIEDGKGDLMLGKMSPREVAFVLDGIGYPLINSSIMR